MLSHAQSRSLYGTFFRPMTTTTAFGTTGWTARRTIRVAHGNWSVASENVRAQLRCVLGTTETA